MDSDPPHTQLDNNCVILIMEQLLFRKKVHCRLGDSERSGRTAWRSGTYTGLCRIEDGKKKEDIVDRESIKYGSLERRTSLAFLQGME